MSPEIIIALITAASVIGAAVVAAIPAFLSLRRRTAAEGATTRDAMAEALASLGSRVDARIDDVRDDIDNVREDVARVREWQAGHDAEHLLIGQQPPPRGDS
ncbi:hypothetical protein ACGFZB_28610 [Streptomyces cinerochromogenes]|uniref:Minor tail protein n=1 Tax=Streptomyces cinerochromogenes TaxID=66422 RepID=A0ABW7BAS8_9ACTN